MTRVSVIIPTYNAAPWLQSGLEMLFNQSVADQMEVIIIDSGSTDQTLNIAGQFPVRVHQIPNEAFNHGTTRNLGVQLAKGDYVLMTVQDAIGSSEYWIEELLHHFKNDRVAGVCGGQAVPHDEDKNPVEWSRAQSSPKARNFFFDTAREFDELPPKEKNNLCSWDNVNAIYRKTALLEIPFKKTLFAEDMLWAKEALRHQKQIVYTRKPVYHYHHQTPTYTYKRELTTLYHSYLITGYVPEVLEKWPLRMMLSWLKSLVIHARIADPKKVIHWMRYNLNIHQHKRAALIDLKKALEISEQAAAELHRSTISIAPVAKSPRQASSIELK